MGAYSDASGWFRALLRFMRLVGLFSIVVDLREVLELFLVWAAWPLRGRNFIA